MAIAQERLTGLTVLVTRPVHQADRLCALIETEGGTALRFPTLAIRPPTDPAAAAARLARLADYDLAIFTSANAVDQALALLPAGLPSGPLRAAVGKATADALARRGWPAELVPTVFNSEALLELPALRQVAERRALIVRGEGGRPLLGDMLKARGARVDFAEVYRRGRPDTNPGELRERGARGEIHAVIVTSNETLRNLFEILGEPGQQWLPHTPLVVISGRTRDLARELGFQRPIMARKASDEAIVQALLRWRQARFESPLGTP